MNQTIDNALGGYFTYKGENKHLDCQHEFIRTRSGALDNESNWKYSECCKCGVIKTDIILAQPTLSEDEEDREFELRVNRFDPTRDYASLREYAGVLSQRLRQMDKRCKKANSRADKLRDSAKWQSIATAPKDGTVIDIWDKKRITSVSYHAGDTVGYSEGGKTKSRFDTTYSGWWRGDFAGMCYLPDILSKNPTHWMPLPPAPEVK